MTALLIFCTLISCGAARDVDNPIITVVGPKEPKDPREKSGIDPAFIVQISLFEDLTGLKVENLPINFGDTGENKLVIGVCNTYVYKSTGTVYKEILIKKEYWEEATDDEKETLMLHELGHCVLNRHHENGRMDFEGYEIPVSIMNEYNIGGNYYYSPNREHYHKELGNGE